MMDIIFKVKENFNTSPNALISLHKDYDFVGCNLVFGELSKTNIFIGENNSGKSRFLRNLFSTSFSYIVKDDVSLFKSSFNISNIYGRENVILESEFKIFNDIYDKVDKDRNHYRNYNSIFFETLSRCSKSISNENKFYFPVLRGTKDYKKIINKKLGSFLQSTTTIQNKDSINHFISLLNLQNNGFQSFYIYKDVVENEYFSDKNSFNGKILTGGTLYNEIKSMLLGSEQDRTLIRDFQTFIKKMFFDEYNDFQLIPNEKYNVLYVKIGDTERPIYNWGDGTQQLIVILYSLYKHKDEQNKIFFIEEPEMYLHPGILRKFIEIINSETFKYHQYFITTHSNIVLDVSADTNISMSIFKFKRVKEKDKNNGKDFLIEQCNNGDVSLLNELGIRNSSVFLSNCSIWVEGITDRLYLNHYLKLYCKKFENKKLYRENIDYTFIEYGGGNIVHFNFEEADSKENINAKYINNKMFVIADNDNTKEGTAKYHRKEKLKEALKNNFYELPVVEIENLITLDALKDVLCYQNPNKTQEINQAFSRRKKIPNKKLGKVIDDIFDGKDIKKYSASSGTIKNKLDFCKSVIEVVNDYEKLSPHAKELTEKIYEFIEKNNSI